MKNVLARPADAAKILALLAVAVITLALRTQPLSLANVPGDRDQFTWRGSDGREHVYLGDYDSYLWAREARNYLRSGTTCDVVADGVCRDTFTSAPVGVAMHYRRSLHIAAIVAVHKLITTFVPQYPLTASAFWVPVIVAVVGAIPAFAIGSRLAGLVGGFAAALMIEANPYFLQRSIGSDNDVWNVVLPLFAVWATIAALDCERRARRLCLAGLASFVFALHAITWSGWLFCYGVVLASLSLALVVDGARAWHAPVRPMLERTLTVLCVLVFATPALVLLAAGGTDAFGHAADIVREFATLRPQVSANAGATALVWPNVFATIAELRRYDLGRLAASLGGPFYLFVAWLGLLVLLLPRRDWAWQHFAVLIGGTLLYRMLLAIPDRGQTLLLLLLALPLVAAEIAAFTSNAEASSRQLHPSTVLLAFWFLAALFKAFDALRFLILLVPVYGLVVGIALGRLHEWLVGAMSPRVFASERWAASVSLAITLSLLVPPVVQGMATARAYRPAIDDAWWDTLVRLRESSPSEAIVTTWWDFGDWVKYVAERRVNADGSTLKTHVPHWIARALVAETEDETVGLLRMLNCGSDTTPEPEARFGAWNKLKRYGRDPLEAYADVIALADRTTKGARSFLLESGLSGNAADDVLASTHCDPPPTYLVLSSVMVRGGTWRSLGAWDPRRQWLADALGDQSKRDLLRTLTTRLATPPAQAEALYAEAVASRDKGDLRKFLSPQLPYATPTWNDCSSRPDPGDGHETWSCAFGLVPQGVQSSLVVYDPLAPNHTRIVTADGDLAPAALLIAGDRELNEARVDGTPHPELGVLVDLGGRRVLVGPPRLLRSTLTQLWFLDGRYLRHFEQVDDRTGYADNRVRTWRVTW